MNASEFDAYVSRDPKAADFSLTTTPANPEALHVTEPAYYLPLNLIQPSTFNPRKRFDNEGLAKLADSIAANGVQQAIVVRRIEGAAQGRPQYEIVAGERRWRACQLNAESGKFTGPFTIPAFVRVLDDFTARDIALTENSNRTDLHPIEEAEAFEALLLHRVGGGDFSPPRLRGYTVEQLAARIGHKPNYVFGRLKLLELTPEGREAFFDGRLQTKVAEAIARMPAPVQAQALPEILRGWGGEPYSHRQALQFLRDRFMLKLGSAVFDIKDASLVPAAGDCQACPKRTGANPGLFDDVDNADTCTDPDCFNGKVKAHGAALLDRARDKGLKVLVDAEAKKVMPYGEYSLANTGHVFLDKPNEAITGSKKTLRMLLGPDFEGAILVKPEGTDLPITVAKDADVKAALKAKGLLNGAGSGSGSGKAGAKGSKPLTADDIKKQRNQRIDSMLGSRLPGALAKHLEADQAQGIPGESPTWLRWLAERLYDQHDGDHDALAIALTGQRQLGNWRDELEPEQLARLVIMLTIGSAVADEFEPWSGKAHTPDTANALAADIQFDLAALRTEVQDEVDAAIRDEIAALADVVKPTKPKLPTKKAAGKANKSLPPVKYRNADTGESWSGRGLQPKWLKVALEGGAKLSDFSIAETISTPGFSAAAQGTASPAAKPKKQATDKADAEALTPEKALAQAVAKEGKPKASKKPKKTEQTDDTAKPQASTESTGESKTLEGSFGTISLAAAWPFPKDARPGAAK